MIQILLLLSLPFRSTTSESHNSHAALARLLMRYAAFFLSLVCVKAPTGFNYFSSVALLSYSAKSPRVKEA